MDLGLLGAFVGGTLSLLSPCAALLLPAFFSSIAGSGPRLLLHVTVFYAGLMVVLAPLGVAAGSVGVFFAMHRAEIIAGASVLLIVLGVVTALGGGFDVSRVLPSGVKRAGYVARLTGYAKTFVLGGTSGLAGFCVGPILGAILTLAAARGAVGEAVALMAVYAAGMVLPLVALALMWDRVTPRVRGVLRGREFSLLGRSWHTMSLVTGALMIIAGVVFARTNGLVTAPRVVSLEFQSHVQGAVAAVSHPLLDAALVVVAAAGALWWWHKR